MSRVGFISLHRSILDNPIFKIKPFSKGQAWITLLLLANHDKGYVNTKNGQLLEINRGECGYSELALADLFGWSRGKVKRYLTLLINKKMIQQKIVNNHSIITVLNYDKFQNGTINGTINGQQTWQQTDTNNNDNNDNNISSSSSSSNSEIEFFSNYYNVGLTENQYTQLVVDANGKEKLLEILEEFSSAIETGKENKFSYDLPNAHFERLKSWIKQRKKNPNVIKFQSQPQESGRDIQMRAVDKVCKEWEEKLRKEGRLK